MKTEPREVWVQRVQRLADSGLTAKEFASEIGVNPHTLAGWRWRLSREAVEGSASSSSTPSSSTRPQFIDVTAGVSRAQPLRVRSGAASSASEAFEVVLLSGTRIRVPPSFEPDALRSLLSALEVR